MVSTLDTALSGPDSSHCHDQVLVLVEALYCVLDHEQGTLLS